MSGQTSDSKLGGGPVVIMMDATSIAHQGLRKHIEVVTTTLNMKYNGIRHQVEVQMREVFMSQMKVFQR